MQKLTTLILILSLVITASVLSQSVGDYRTKASGNWSNAQIWERYNGSSWAAIGTPPTGAETITVLAADSVFVNVLVSITDTLINQGIVEANNSLTFANGGTYQHDRDAGKIPISTWEQGSTLYMTGVTGVAPDDRNQSYYDMTFNTPGLLSNLNMALDSVTIGGDVKVINTGSARWYLTSADRKSVV